MQNGETFPFRSIVGGTRNSGEDTLEQGDAEEDTADKDDTENDDIDIVLTEEPVDSSPELGFAPDLQLKFETIRTLHDATADVRTISEQEAIAGRLRDAINDLGTSGEFKERLWRAVNTDRSNSTAQGNPGACPSSVSIQQNTNSRYSICG